MLIRNLVCATTFTVFSAISSTASAWHVHKKPNLTGLFVFNSLPINTSCQSVQIAKTGPEAFGQGSTNCKSGFSLRFDQNAQPTITHTMMNINVGLHQAPIQQVPQNANTGVIQQAPSNRGFFSRW